MTCVGPIRDLKKTMINMLNVLMEKVSNIQVQLNNFIKEMKTIRNKSN